MESLNLNFKFWLTGLIAGVVLVERWRRYGRRKADKQKTSSSIVAGAKADADRLRRFVDRVSSTVTPDTADSPSTPASA